MRNIFLLFAGAFCILSACKNDATTSVGGTTYNVDQNKTIDTDSESEKFEYSLGVLIGTTLKNGGLDSVNYGKVVQAFDDSEADQIVYSIAADQARKLASEEFDLADLDKDIIVKGIYDVVDADTTLLNGLEVQQAYTNYLQSNQLKIGEANLEAGKAFLENNKNREGIQIAENGLQYILQEEGTGEAITSNDVIEVHYTGTNIDGEEFDTTRDGEPYVIDVAEPRSAVPGFMQALTLYPIGSKFQVFIPSNLGYGPQRLSPEVGPNSTLIFDVETVRKLDRTESKQYRDYVKQILQQQQPRR
ncbi:MAG: FKBP-type peptidyl-prolyl cis-trans isomerase [Saprospiraceae bacterium]|nr:FKBP-type peptidyl-prolyl cis-trans isomerase [Saprospiraceae bacterium]